MTTERTSLERAIVRDQGLAVVSLLLVAGACWAWIVPMSRDMYGSMSGPASWMMTPSGGLRTWRCSLPCGPP